MFLIPSHQIPDLFDAKVVNEDFEIICKRASSILGVSTQKLMDSLQQSAEDELQHRFQKAIQKARSSQDTMSTKTNEIQTPKEKKTHHLVHSVNRGGSNTRCSVEACVVKKISKPQYIDGNLYCAAHYKQIKAKQLPLSSSSTTTTTLGEQGTLTYELIPGSTEGTNKLKPKPILEEEHRSYWSCVPISYIDTTGQEVHYKLHKPTGIILDKVEDHDGHISFALIGHYEDNNFTDKSELESTLLDWCKQSGIVV